MGKKSKDSDPKKSTSEKKEARKPKFPEIPEEFKGFFGSGAGHATLFARGSTTGFDKICDLLNDLANKQIFEKCAEKEFIVDSIFKPCKGGGSGSTKAFDLVILTDTSGSMTDEAVALSAAAAAAIDNAKKSCPSDLRVVWLGLGGSASIPFPGQQTNFDKILRKYLLDLGVAGTDIRHINNEDGAKGIQDLSNLFDWRSGATRVIFYLGDEPLEHGSPHDASDVAEANIAIGDATKANVTVYTYAGSSLNDPTTVDPDVLSEYERLASATGGLNYSYGGSGLNDFETILKDIICSSAGSFCGPAKIPELRPCFSLQWGDGPNDSIETDDLEVLCLTATNPYTNVVLKDITAYVMVLTTTSANGLPEALPDGSPSVEIKPSYVISFGDLMPCGHETKPDPCYKGGLSSVSRELVMINRGAKAGDYFILAAYCYKVELPMASGSIFPLELVKS